MCCFSSWPYSFVGVECTYIDIFTYIILTISVYIYVFLYVHMLSIYVYKADLLGHLEPQVYGHTMTVWTLWAVFFFFLAEAGGIEVPHGLAPG